MNMQDVVVIGAGPGGIAAAIQLKRYGIEPLLLEKDRIGGLLLNAHRVENYPGFPEGIAGIDLAGLFEAQLKGIGVRVCFEEVLRLDYEDAFLIQTRKQVLRSRIVVIASGTKPKEIDFPCDAPERAFSEIRPIANVAGRRIVIIGAGDAAFDYALNLGRKNEVLILNRNQGPKCLPLLQERVQQISSIVYREDSRVRAVKRTAEGVIVSYANQAGECELQADYVIFAIGRTAQTDYLAPGLKERVPDLEKRGLLYFVGDVKNGIFRQTSIAVGDGMQAAMRIYQRLQETGSCES
ncbi:MAG: NAD(P)/FAD-dependent oxidoreductase [Dehalococcoidia bacterium]|nr:NAD(P)/FAD-dependent oxidoreductase [Dehalococcoidia bacterium]